ncbi:MAG: protein phosphatase 2C domain-containing protein [gamma proteobacterium symbiont of Taylorina sp.]|nr:protein phosphatase 2C domain-containing protein [gamma proteobacterium symbiont of Taylorina sp.]
MIFKNLIDKLSAKADVVQDQCHSIAVSDVGRKRKLNEDCVLIDEHTGLSIVADGMGGHRAGEVASNLAIKTIAAYIKTHSNNAPLTPAAIEKILHDAIEEANYQINQKNTAQDIPEGQGMGTTITGFVKVHPGDKTEQQIVAFNVGDSRCYSFYQRELKQLSTDHSHYQLWKETGKVGEEPRKNIIYKAIGPWKKVVADLYTHHIRKSELLLLCSDGLSDMLSDNIICAILDKNNNNLKQTANSLISAANDAGGKDNITVLLYSL